LAEVRVGSKVAFVAHFLGRRIAYTYEIVEFVPGRRLVMRTSRILPPRCALHGRCPCAEPTAKI
jgi:hypothetical protein